MTSRPSFSNKRPLSAIFLGSNSSSSSSSNIPDLPEPPSPSASSSHSGLPSPPATNSTGSGSVGDNNSNNAGSLRNKASSSQSTMINGDYRRSQHTRHLSTSSSTLDNVQDENEIDDEEEQTARFGVGKKALTTSPPPDNVSALHRVKNLTKRNQEALDKLATMRNTPSPGPGRSGPSIRSPLPSSSTASASSHRIVSHPLSARIKESTPSGSETERENHPLSSDDRDSSPPSSMRHVRQRIISAPDSPSRDKRTSPSGPGRRANAPHGSKSSHSVDHNADDVTSAALAAVASSRRSPTDRRTRQPLPKEFRDDGRSSDSQHLADTTTPHRNRSIKIIDARRSPSPSNMGYNSTSHGLASPRGSRTSLRYSTLRDLKRVRSLRNASEDISSYTNDDDLIGGSIRRQSTRGGSAESALANGRTLVGEGLRAAGIVKRRETTDDVFREPFKEQEESRQLLSNASSSSFSHVEWDDSQDSELARVRAQRRVTLSMARMNEGAGLPSGVDPPTPAATTAARQPSRAQTRPATSMAGYHYTDEPIDDRRVFMFRSQRSSVPSTEGDRDQLSRASSRERPYTSPFGIPRQLTATPLSAQRERITTGEHGKLMFDSLSIFESHLSRLPPMGNTTTTTIPELFRSAQSIVQATERLNTLLRNGTNKALEAQISAEVSGGLDEGNVEMSEYWRGVGSEFRDSLRVSDELVRNMTGFLLGVGKVLRDTSTSMSGQQQHMRAVSLDDASHTVAKSAGGRSSEGRSMAPSRLSWDHVRREGENRASSREGVNSNWPSSSSRDSKVDDTPPTATTQPSAPTSAVRHFFTPRDRDSPVGTVGPTSRRGILDYNEAVDEPSPTPAFRQQHSSRTGLSSTIMPRPLPILPASSFTKQQNSDSELSNRKKMSTNSANTVRAGSSFQPTVTTPSATTAITPHTVSFPQRSESNNSIQGIGFSRSSTVSVSALNGLRQRESRPRLGMVNYSSSEEQPATPAADTVRTQPMSATTDREKGGWRTIGQQPVRASLDGFPHGENDGVNPPESYTTRLSRRERRRTIAEIFGSS